MAQEHRKPGIGGPGAKVSPTRPGSISPVLPAISRSEMRWVLVEAADRILPEVVTRCA